jgi:hypothetical protein
MSMPRPRLARAGVGAGLRGRRNLFLGGMAARIGIWAVWMWRGTTVGFPLLYFSMRGNDADVHEGSRHFDREGSQSERSLRQSGSWLVSMIGTAGRKGAMGRRQRSFPMMKRISMAAALLATTLGVGVALAQSNQAPSSEAPMMQRGADKSGMMDMSKMNRMMDNCNRMMEGMQQHPPSEPGTTTPDKG